MSPFIGSEEVSCVSSEVKCVAGDGVAGESESGYVGYIHSDRSIVYDIVVKF